MKSKEPTWKQVEALIKRRFGITPPRPMAKMTTAELTAFCVWLDIKTRYSASA